MAAPAPPFTCTSLVRLLASAFFVSAGVQHVFLTSGPLPVRLPLPGTFSGSAWRLSSALSSGVSSSVSPALTVAHEGAAESFLVTFVP